jgi:hypothetical protein
MKKMWYRIRKFFGQLTYEEEREEAVAGIKATLPPMPPTNPPPYNSSIGTFAGSNSCSGAMFSGSIIKDLLKWPENIPGPHPKPPKKKKLQPRCITDDWEVTQDQEK